MIQGKFERTLYDHFKKNADNMAKAYCVTAPEGLAEQLDKIVLTTVHSGDIKDGYCYLMGTTDDEKSEVHIVDYSNRPGGYAHIVVH